MLHWSRTPGRERFRLTSSGTFRSTLPIISSALRRLLHLSARPLARLPCHFQGRPLATASGRLTPGTSTRTSRSSGPRPSANVEHKNGPPRKQTSYPHWHLRRGQPIALIQTMRRSQPTTVLGSVVFLSIALAIRALFLAHLPSPSSRPRLPLRAPLFASRSLFCVQRHELVCLFSPPVPRSTGSHRSCTWHFP